MGSDFNLSEKLVVHSDEPSVREIEEDEIYREYHFIWASYIKEFIKKIKNLDESGDKSDDFMIINKSKFNKMVGAKLI